MSGGLAHDLEPEIAALGMQPCLDATDAAHKCTRDLYNFEKFIPCRIHNM